MRLIVCDLGLGNIRSVTRAFQAAGDGRVSVETTSDPHVLAQADLLVVPGQGAFRDFAAALELGTGDAIRNHIARGRPYFGICLGLQVLFEASEESPGARGLGVFEGQVRRLPSMDSDGVPLKIPHIGWNNVEWRESEPMLSQTGTDYYFVHSYVAHPKDESLVCARTTYGVSFASAVRIDSLFACQFHPEKSQRLGLELIRDFIAR